MCQTLSQTLSQFSPTVRVTTMSMMCVLLLCHFIDEKNHLPKVGQLANGRVCVKLQRVATPNWPLA